MTTATPTLQAYENSLMHQAELLDGWVDLGRQIGALEAQRAELLAERLDILAQGRSLDPGSEEIAFRSMYSEYAAAGHLSPNVVSAQIASAWVLVRLYPATLDALASGAISRRHADVILAEAPQVTGNADAERVRSEYEQQVLAFAAQETAARTRVHARGVAVAVAPESATERHRRARSERSVTVKPDGEGMAVLTAILPELLAYAIHDRLTSMARGLVDARPKGQRRPRTSTLDKIRAEREAAIAAEQEVHDAEPPATDLEDAFRDRMTPASPWDLSVTTEDAAATPWDVRPAAGSADRHDADRHDADRVSDDGWAPLTDDWVAPEDENAPPTGDDVLWHDSIPMHDGYGPIEPDSRSMDQLRADLLADLLLTTAPTSATETALGSVHANVQVTIAAETLRGADDNLAEFDGHGPLAPEVARVLAGQSVSWDRVYLDPKGLAVSTDNYVPTAAMKRFLRIRDQHCGLFE